MKLGLVLTAIDPSRLCLARTPPSEIRNDLVELTPSDYPLTPSPQAMSAASIPSRIAQAQSETPLLFDSVLLGTIRLALFFACRKFLKRTLSPALRRVSKPEYLIPRTSDPFPATNDEEGQRFCPNRSVGFIAQLRSFRACSLTDSSTPFISPNPTRTSSSSNLSSGPYPSRDPYSRQDSNLDLSSDALVSPTRPPISRERASSRSVIHVDNGDDDSVDTGTVGRRPARHGGLAR